MSSTTQFYKSTRAVHPATQSTKAAAEERWLSVNLAFFCCQPLTENPNMSPSLPESQQLDAVSSSPPYSTPTANLFFAWSIALLKRMDTT